MKTNVAFAFISSLDSNFCVTFSNMYITRNHVGGRDEPDGLRV